MGDTTRGIYRKYKVERVSDPTGKHKECAYFVLDLEHDAFAVPALRAYAKACAREFPELANDIATILAARPTHFGLGPQNESEMAHALMADDPGDAEPPGQTPVAGRER